MQYLPNAQLNGQCCHRLGRCASQYAIGGFCSLVKRKCEQVYNIRDCDESCRMVFSHEVVDRMMSDVPVHRPLTSSIVHFTSHPYRTMFWGAAPTLDRRRRSALAAWRPGSGILRRWLAAGDGWRWLATRLEDDGCERQGGSREARGRCPPQGAGMRRSDSDINL